MVIDHEDNPPNVPARDRATLLPEPERDTSPEDLSLPSVAATIDPETMRGVDSEFSEAVRLLVEAGREMAAEREARREAAERSSHNQQTLIDQQAEVIRILQRTEKTTEANYELLLDAIKQLQSSDAAQNGKLSSHETQLAHLRESVHAIKSEILDAIPLAIEKAVAPHVQRLDELEQLLTNGTTEAPTAQ